ncbi:tRNA (adenosine(37)-N6)-threonylcarbamoyltransferase complex transferase subunit TsaD [Candidatus Karelsulcia muelleri]|uniref:tRNA (adenosine(37)-N6)-threonylcarbamoyltransferase complex transferase subunit TsaD n=1 Tax=Candidatus Karelsulcia muelleri TaxID=336810 RepID=UPI0023646D32|nr:tRNA (adenosine(37)-N6)-threonylcarbamoyltransferase complex transferase subunit TsaD [Candidatus Karelsulcia muelleri]WDE42240.1 tRNA (adenosine(37)-N6)-threonylcarbamoyltransferase complex transferase subunit TsaD [Candidatus Karelsulcia muelleri]
MKKKNLIILGIDTSCDDTCAAIIKNNTVLSNIVRTQQIHKKFGGVVPELASILHLKHIVYVVKNAILKAKITTNAINAIAFTKFPGLIGSLLVGSAFAKSLAMCWKIPLISVNHIQAHILANFLEGVHSTNPNFPFISLSISGGHTNIIKVKDFLEMKILGSSNDISLGNLFDNIAKVLGFQYPWGRIIEKYAQLGNSKKFCFNKPKVKNLNFSFSGLQTKLLYFLNKKIKNNSEFVSQNINDICASFQDTVFEILFDKLNKTVQKTGIKNIVFSGGISSNIGLQKFFSEKSIENNWKTFFPKSEFSTDNAAMIALVGKLKYERNLFDKFYD